MAIPFNQIVVTGRHLQYIQQAIANQELAGGGKFTRSCQALLETLIGGRVLLTHSCTAALEMAAILLNIKPGDEVIMPSFTFSSTANAIVLRGGVPVFVDIRADTLNLDENLVEQAITNRTRAVCVVHYAGVGCEMDEILSIASRHDLAVIEDAAQSMYAKYRGRPLGSLGTLAAISFHESKNITAGECGALVINDPDLGDRAEIVWEKGTNRVQFSRGACSRYTWLDVGSSFLPSEITAAFLLAQLEIGRDITNRRLSAWDRYHNAFAELEAKGRLRRPIVPAHCDANGHIYYVLAPYQQAQQHWLADLARQGIHGLFHYVPLHSAPAGLKFGRTHGKLDVTNDVAGRLIRLPIYSAFAPGDQDEVINAVRRLAQLT